MAFNLFKKREAPEAREDQALNDETPSDILLQSLINGEKITRAQALEIPAVSANVDFITNAIASMPVKLFKYKQGHIEEVENDPRVRLLNNDTGDTLDGFQFKKALVEDYLLSSGGYAYIQKYRNTVTGLYYVENEFVVIEYNYQPIHKNYCIYVESGKYQPFDFIKLLRNTKNGAFGVGIIDELDKALETAYQTMIFQLGNVKTGGNKKGFLKSEQKLTDQAMTALKNAWRRLYSNNSENVIVLNKGLDFKEASNTSVEMQLNESIDTLNKSIDRIFHIYDDFNDTFKFAIYPIVKAFETALNRDLLLEKEKKNYFFEFDVKEIIKASIKDRYEVYRMSKECQMTTINERRRMENMNEIDGGDVIDLGLGSVLYDVNTKTYYTPNSNTISSGSNEDNSQAGAEVTPEEVKTIEEESFIDKLNGSEGNV